MSSEPSLIDAVEYAGGRIAPTSFVAKTCKIQHPIDIADLCTIYGGTEIGKFTYINVNSIVYSNAKIGSYCSFGRFVEIGVAQHPINFLSTHPFQINNTLFGRSPAYCAVTKKKWNFHPATFIGHDVWIGAKSVVCSGVNVGHGAVIAAGSVVTKDVPPYAIVGGVPAKVIKYRFDETIITALLKLEWWNFPIDALINIDFDDITRAIPQLQAIKVSHE